jgi:hypothetical protein
VYCSRRCGSLASAKKSTRERLNQEHKQNIERARKAIREWTPSDGDWKEFVSKRTGLTVKWVSRNEANKKYPHRELRAPSSQALTHSTKDDRKKLRGEKHAKH